jgi:3-oxoacyl-[acyl-carrier-protein] synthase-3
MSISTISNVEILGVSVAVPKNQLSIDSFAEQFGLENIEKFKQATGIKSIGRSIPEQTASDLGFEAANRLLSEQQIETSEIGILLFLSQKPDFRSPNNAFIVHNRLGLAKDCLCFDINLACSGFIVALQSIHQLLSHSSKRLALLITADTSHRTISPLDRTMIMLFGDSGSAILLGKTNQKNNQASFSIQSDGTRFKSIITPAGAFRNLDANQERTVWSDGIMRSDFDTHMKGMEVFEFSITDVPNLIKSFLNERNQTPEDFDYFVLHQANQYILKQISRKVKIPTEKIPISLDRYGNNSSNSIPLVLADHFAHESSRQLQLFFSGFGAGLSWGCATVQINTNTILPILKTDNFYTPKNKENE